MNGNDWIEYCAQVGAFYNDRNSMLKGFNVFVIGYSRATMNVDDQCLIALTGPDLLKCGTVAIDKRAKMLRHMKFIWLRIVDTVFPEIPVRKKRHRR